MKKHYEEKQYIELDDCDLNFNIKIKSLINLAERVSIHHADLHNLGKKYTYDKGWGWIISRAVLTMKKWPKYEDEITAVSLAFKGIKTIYPRQVFFYDEKGKEIGNFLMLFHLLSYKDRTTIDVPKRNDYFEEEDFPFEKLPRSIQINKDKFEKIFTHKVCYNDLDFNSHLNNLKYIEHATSKETSSFFKNKNIKEIVLQFNEETKEGEELTFFRSTSKGVVKYIAKKKGKDIFKMQISYI